MKKIFFLAAMAAFISCSDDNDTQKNQQGPVEDGALSENFRAIPAVHSDFQDISFIDREHGVATGTEGVVIKTDDGGATWTNLTTGTNISFSCLFMYDANTVFAARRGLFKWDGRTNMDIVGDLGEYSGALSGLRFFDHQTGFAVKESMIIKTTDGGNTWNIIHGDHAYIKGLFFASRDVAYGWGGVTRDGGSGAQLIKTTDGGATWTDLQIQTTQIKALQFTDDHTGFIINMASEFMKTTDGGVTWTKIGKVPRITNSDVSDLLYVSDQQIFVTTYGGQLLKSANGGKDWEVIYQHEHEIANSLNKIIRVDRSIYVVGDRDLILRND